MVVFSFVMATFSAVPSISGVVFSNVKPRSSETTTPPVRVAISCSISFLRSPKPGALTAATLIVPRRRLTTRVVRASPSTSSAMIRRDLPSLAIGSRIGSRSFIEEIFLSVIRIIGWSKTASILSGLVIKYGEI